MKPKVRSKLRLWLGRLYFTSKRYAEWVFGSVKIAMKRIHRIVIHHGEIFSYWVLMGGFRPS